MTDGVYKTEDMQYYNKGAQGFLALFDPWQEHTNNITTRVHDDVIFM